MGCIALNLKPQVRGVCVVTRKGVVVTETPPATPLPSRIAKAVEKDKGNDKDEASSSEAEDPF